MSRRHSAVYAAWGLVTASLALSLGAQAAANYVRVGLNEALAGKPISKATTQPYGCSVKYKSSAL